MQQQGPQAAAKKRKKKTQAAQPPALEVRAEVDQSSAQQQVVPQSAVALAGLTDAPTQPVMVAPAVEVVVGKTKKGADAGSVRSILTRQRIVR
jgi:hypothetical protein